MEPGQIVDALRVVKHKLPKSALEAASADRAACAPHFIHAFEHFSIADATDDARAEKLFFMYHLLGEWSDPEAHRPLCRFLRRPTAEIEPVLGDSITTTAHHVISAVFDGDPQPIFDVVMDPAADDFIRWNMCETLAHLVLDGRLDRAIVVTFLRDCFSHMQPQRASHAWNGWVAAVAILGLAEFRSIVEAVFTRGYADEGIHSFKEFTDDLAVTRDRAKQSAWRDDRNYRPFTSVIDEMSTWYSFRPEALRDERRAAAAQAERERPAPPAKLAGRNATCPCGSGAKYKTCCLN